MGNVKDPEVQLESFKSWIAGAAIAGSVLSPRPGSAAPAPEQNIASVDAASVQDKVVNQAIELLKVRGSLRFKVPTITPIRTKHPGVSSGAEAWVYNHQVYIDVTMPNFLAACEYYDRETYNLYVMHIAGVLAHEAAHIALDKPTETLYDKEKRAYEMQIATLSHIGAPGNLINQVRKSMKFVLEREKKFNSDAVTVTIGRT